jgi:hypothetical protein
MILIHEADPNPSIRVLLHPRRYIIGFHHRNSSPVPHQHPTVIGFFLQQEGQRIWSPVVLFEEKSTT